MKSGPVGNRTVYHITMQPVKKKFLAHIRNVPWWWFAMFRKRRACASAAAVVSRDDSKREERSGAVLDFDGWKKSAGSFLTNS
jgi:hypothetical protein